MPTSYSARSTLLQRLSGYSSSSMHRTGSNETLVELQPPVSSQTLSAAIDPRNCCWGAIPKHKHTVLLRRENEAFVALCLRAHLGFPSCEPMSLTCVLIYVNVICTVQYIFCSLALQQQHDGCIAGCLSHCGSPAAGST